MNKIFNKSAVMMAFLFSIQSVNAVDLIKLYGSFSPQQAVKNASEALSAQDNKTSINQISSEIYEWAPDANRYGENYRNGQLASTHGQCSADLSKLLNLFRLKETDVYVENFSFQVKTARADFPGEAIYWVGDCTSGVANGVGFVGYQFTKKKDNWDTLQGFDRFVVEMKNGKATGNLELISEHETLNYRGLFSSPLSKKFIGVIENGVLVGKNTITTEIESKQANAQAGVNIVGGLIGKVVVSAAKAVVECKNDPVCSKESAQAYTDYKIVRSDNDGVYVRCLPDKSYSKEERLWYRNGNYTASGWFSGYPSLDKAAKLVCSIIH